MDVNNISEFDIAIIGYSAQFPGAPNAVAYWNNLITSTESITTFTDEELKDSGVAAELINNPNFVKAAPILEDADCFDASFFGYSPLDAQYIDPQQRLLLELGHSALEHAGLKPNNFDGRIGTFAGTAMNSYMIHTGLINQFYTNYLSTLLGSDKDFIATRLAFKLGLTGPAVSIQTACSTSLVALHTACQSLISNESDAALVGAAAIRAPIKTGHLFEERGVLSPDGRCKPFDETAAGTIFGSGGGAIILKRLKDAVESGDHIHAVVRGTAINNDGDSKADYTAPSVRQQSQVISEALAAADVSADTISYVEAHGTGTYLGDPIEIKALTRAYSSDTDKTQYCDIGSVKSNIGHLDAAAGIAGLIKVVLALNAKEIPPTLHFNRENPQIGFNKTPFQVVDKLKKWDSPTGPRRAGITALGMGGTNAHVILEEFDQTIPAEPQDTKPNKTFFLLSAKTSAALTASTSNLKDFLQKNPLVDLNQVAGTLFNGRTHYNKRTAFAASSVEEAITVLDSKDRLRLTTTPVNPENRATVLMFPGQGSQYTGMAKNLFENCAKFRKRIHSASDQLMDEIGMSLMDVIFTDQTSNEKLINQTYITQPALFAIEYAYAEWLIDRGINPKAMIGHSIGEYVSAAHARVFDFETGIRLVALRGKLMQSCDTGAMLAMNIPADKAQNFLNSNLDLAVINGPDTSVVAGDVDSIKNLKNELDISNIKSSLLRTSHAFHSQMMEPAADKFAEKIKNTQFQNPSIPFISNVSGEYITDDEATNPNYWASQIRSTVQFSKGIETLLDDGPVLFLEAGPGTVLTSLVNDREGSEHYAISVGRSSKTDIDDAVAASTAIAKAWTAGLDLSLHFEAKKYSHKIPLPTYPFEKKRHWFENKDIPLIPNAVKGVERTENIDNWAWTEGWTHLPIADAATETAFSNSAAVTSDVTYRNAQTLPISENSGLDIVSITDLSTSYKNQKTINYDRLVYLWNHELSAENNLTDLLDLTKLLTSLEGQRSIQLDVLTQNSTPVLGHSVLNPEGSLARGFLGVLAKEWEHIHCRYVDTNQSSIAVAIGKLDTLPFQSTFSELAYYSGQWFKPTLINLPFANNFIDDSFGDKISVSVIFGAFGGIGKVLTRYLANLGYPLALVGHSPLPERSEWSNLKKKNDDKPLLQRIEFIESIESLNVNITFHQADISQLQDVEMTLKGIFKTHGKIGNVYHLAGYSIDAPLVLKTPDDITRTLNTKVNGSHNLAKALAEYQASRLILFASTSAWMSPAGQLDYAAANAYQLALPYAAEYSTDIRGIAWPGWIDTGMLSRMNDKAAKAIAESHGIAPDMALDTLQRILLSNYKSCGVSPVDPNLVLRKPLELTRSDAKTKTVSAPQETDATKDNIEIIRQHWCELLGFEELGDDENFFEIGGTSLVAVKLFARLERVFNISLPIEILFHSATIKLLDEYISNALPTTIIDSNNNGGNNSKLSTTLTTKNTFKDNNRSSVEEYSSESPSGHNYTDTGPGHTTIDEQTSSSDLETRKQDSKSVASARPIINREKSLVLIAKSNSNALPLYLIHAHGGIVIWYRKLAEQISKERPVYGLQSQGLNKDGIPLNTIEEMASLYVNEIINHQPTGPYLIAAHCMGGTIAWEMARIFEQTGREVVFLGMIQAFHRSMPYPVPQGRGAEYTSAVGIAKQLRLLVDRLKYIPARHTEKAPLIAIFSSVTTQLRRRIGGLFSNRLGKKGIDKNNALLENERLSRVQKLNVDSFWNYYPQSILVKPTFYITEEQPSHAKKDPTLGWSGILSPDMYDIHILKDTTYLAPTLDDPEANLAQTINDHIKTKTQRTD